MTLALIPRGAIVCAFCVGTTACADPRSQCGPVVNAQPAREIQLGIRLYW
jgi:hypothetical protein